MSNFKIKFILLLYFSFRIFLVAQDGKVELYYNDGKLKAELGYVQGVLNGFSTWYFHNGNKQKEVYYNDGKIDGAVRYFYENGLLKAEFNVKNGVRDGLTKFYYPNGGLKEVKSYENGELIKTVKVSYDPTYKPPIEMYLGAVNQLEKRRKGNSFLCGAERCPEPIGGMETILSKLVYPKKALLYGLEGKVILKAYVDEKGDVEKVKVEQGLGLGCTEAAIKAVKSTKFLPAEENGKVVKTWVSLVIDFKIPKKQKSVAVATPMDLEIPEQDVLKEEKNTDSLVAKEPLVTEEKTAQVVESPESKGETLSLDSTKVVEEKVSKILIPEHIQLLSCDVDVCPKPIGGIEAIEKNLEVPRKVKELKLEGNVIVLTTVDEFGNVRDTKVIQRLGHGCDEAAEVAILDSRFKPGRKNGKRVRSHIKILVPYSYRRN